MRGAALKLGQVLSIQEENLIPSYIRKAFDKARDSSYKMPEGQFNRLMEGELGEDWENQWFEEFDREPFAAASIGQVHKGECWVEELEGASAEESLLRVSSNAQSESHFCIFVLIKLLELDVWKKIE